MRWFVLLLLVGLAGCNRAGTDAAPDGGPDQPPPVEWSADMGAVYAYRSPNGLTLAIIPTLNSPINPVKLPLPRTYQ